MQFLYRKKLIFLLTVGKRRCHVLTVGNINSDAAGLNIIVYDSEKLTINN